MLGAVLGSINDPQEVGCWTNFAKTTVEEIDGHAGRDPRQGTLERCRRVAFLFYRDAAERHLQL